jgi:4-hydroxyproline epimerase
MCGHGTIGLAVTLAYLQRLPLGIHQMDTPVGPVQLELHDTHTVSIQNVPSYRLLANVTVELPGFGPVVGDVAWGGNWFFHTSTLPVPLELRHAIQLQDYCWKVRRALSQAGITGEHGAEIDHIMLLDEPKDPQNHRRNFTLCPGGAFDRSPCGTGTSALVACLAAEQQLAPGATWRQESITGSVFQASYQQTDQGIIPTIRGQAYITAETTLIFESSDPLREGYQR